MKYTTRDEQIVIPSWNPWSTTYWQLAQFKGTRSRSWRQHISYLAQPVQGQDCDVNISHTWHSHYNVKIVTSTYLIPGTATTRSRSWRQHISYLAQPVQGQDRDVNISHTWHSQYKVKIVTSTYLIPGTASIQGQDRDVNISHTWHSHYKVKIVMSTYLIPGTASTMSRSWRQHISYLAQPNELDLPSMLISHNNNKL